MLVSEVVNQENDILMRIKEMNKDYKKEHDSYVRQLKWYALLLRTHGKSQIPGTQILSANLDQYEKDVTDFLTEDYYDNDADLTILLKELREYLKNIQTLRSKLKI